MIRTHTCGELSHKNTGETVKLCGWVDLRRDHGGIIFIDLRDRYGITQIKFVEKVNKEVLDLADKLRNEWVIQVEGKVVKRLEVNDKLATGDIELEVHSLKVLSKSEVLPFEISSKSTEANEELRMEYRYLDLRREKMLKNLTLRSNATKLIRDYFNKNGFLDIETPCLIKDTPEGSREYMVPSRIHSGEFYVLPQSPQQLKQLLMVGGIDKYFQIARCFRDEDLRGDRQPEFTQFEIEMSFCEQEDVISVMEKCFIETTKALAKDKKMLAVPFPRMTWNEAMIKYGSDKPDIRYGLEIVPVSELVKDCGFKVFTDAVKNGGVVHALKVDGGTKFTRKDIDELTEVAKQHGAKGLAYINLKEEISSPIIKFIGEDLAKELIKEVKAKEGDIIFFGADEFITACESLGAVRKECANKLEIIPENVFAYLWVVDFPLFEKSKETGQLASVHHPFTTPYEEDIKLLDSDPLKVRSHTFDIVLNGVEVGGGSMRIHNRDLQSKMFTILGISDEDAEKRFGHLLKAFQYGVPPHGGIAIGLDRYIMLLAGEPNIREVMAFPKDGQARDLMLKAPSKVDDELLNELGLKKIDKK